MIEIILHSMPDDEGEILSFDVLRTSSCGILLERIGPFNEIFILDEEAFKDMPLNDKKQLAVELAILKETIWAQQKQ